MASTLKSWIISQFKDIQETPEEISLGFSQTAFEDLFKCLVNIKREGCVRVTNWTQMWKSFAKSLNPGPKAPTDTYAYTQMYRCMYRNILPHLFVLHKSNSPIFSLDLDFESKPILFRSPSCPHQQMLQEKAHQSLRKHHAGGAVSWRRQEAGRSQGRQVSLTQAA